MCFVVLYPEHWSPVWDQKARLFFVPHHFLPLSQFFGLIFVFWPNNLPQQGTTRATLLPTSKQHSLIQRVSWDSRWSLIQPYSPEQLVLTPVGRTCCYSWPCVFTKAAGFFLLARIALVLYSSKAVKHSLPTHCINLAAQTINRNRPSGHQGNVYSSATGGQAIQTSLKNEYVIWEILATTEVLA